MQPLWVAEEMAPRDAEVVVLSPMAAAALAVAVERTRVAAVGAARVAAAGASPVVAVARAEEAAEEDCWTSRTPSLLRHDPMASVRSIRQ